MCDLGHFALQIFAVKITPCDFHLQGRHHLQSHVQSLVHFATPSYMIHFPPLPCLALPIIEIIILFVEFDIDDK